MTQETTSPHKQSTFITWLCLTVICLTPFSNDLFNAGLPQMSVYFNTSGIALCVSTYLAALAVGQLIYGPIFDRFGRRPVLLVALLIYLAGSILTVITSDFHTFLLARFIQGLGASATIIAAISAIKDTSTPEKMTHTLAILFGIVGVAPTIAPMLGSVLTEFIGWRSNFIFLLGIGIFYTIIIFVFFKETQKEKNLDALNILNIIGAVKTLLTNIPYMIYAIAATLSYSSLFLYLVTAPHLIINDFHYAPTMYGYIGVIFGGIVFISSFYMPKIAMKYGRAKTILCGALFQTTGAALMLTLNITLQPTLYTFTAPMLLIIIGFASIRPLGIAIAMERTPDKITGTASAFFNLLIFLGAAIITGLSGYFKDSIVDIALFMLIISIALLALAAGGYCLCLKMKRAELSQ